MDKPKTVELRIPFATLLKIAFSALGIALCTKLAPLGMLVLVAVLIAVTLAPILRWFERKHAPRWIGIGVIVLALTACLALFLGFIVPSVIRQLSEVAKDLPRYRDQLLGQLPRSSSLYAPAEKFLHGEGGPTAPQWIEKALTAGQLVAGAVFEFLLLLIISVFLVADGPRVFRFFTDFFSPLHRLRIRDTAEQVSKIIFAYVSGQAITSATVAACTLITLRILHVPASLTLAMLAGVFDVLPVLGFFLSAVPAILLALTVSPATGLIVAVYCVGYHAFETYFLVPRIYGNRLRLSTLTVLLSLLAADLTVGIVGAIVVLPIIASYPIIERIWLRPWLGHETVDRHEASDDREAS